MRKDFFQKNGLRILFVVVFLLSFIWMGARRTIESNSNSVEDWLPDQYQETGDYKWFLKHFPFESFVVASWDGCTLDDERLEMFAQKLVPGQTIDNFSLVGTETEIVANLDLSKVPERLHRMQAERSKSQTASSEEELESPIVDTDSNASALQYFKSVMTGPRLVRLLEELYAKTPQLNLSKEELDQEISKRLRGTLIGPDGKSTAAIITLEKGQRDGKYLKKVLDQIRLISVECGLPNTMEIKTGSVASKIGKAMADTVTETLHGRKVRMDGIIMGGPPTDNVALDLEGQRTLFRLAGFCALVGGTLAYICLRSIRLTMFVFWISALSAGVAMAMVSFTGGTCDSILLSMPALVYVLAMSGAIHLINYYHDAIREIGLDGANERALEHGFSPCFFAQFTTAIGLGSLYVSGLVPITKFGFYSAIGVMTTLLLIFLYLPALLYFYPSKKFALKYGKKGAAGETGFAFRFWNAFGRGIVRWHNPVALICFLVMGFFAWQLPNIKTSVKMMSFFSSDAEIIQHYSTLEEKLGPLVPMELVVSFDNSKLGNNQYGTIERLRLINRISDTLKTELSEDVGGTLSVGMFTPDIDAICKPGGIAYRMAGAVVRRSIDQNRSSLKDYLSIEGNPSLEDILKAADKKADYYKVFLDSMDTLKKNNVTDLEGIMGMPQDRTWRELSNQTIKEIRHAAENWQQKCGIELWRITIRVWSLKKDIDYSKFITDVKRVVEPILKEESDKIVGPEAVNANVKNPAAETATAAATATAATDSQEDSKSEDPKALPVDDRMGPGHLHDIIHTAGISAKYTGMVPLVYKTQHELIKGLVSSLFSAFIIISIVMMFVLRSIPGGLVAMIPNVFPVIVIFGYMAWRGILVDVGTMMTASVALGVAIDDTMHYLTWYSHGIQRGSEPKKAAVDAYKHCAVAMMQSTIICGLGLSVFALSTFVPTQKFGILMLAILVAAEVGDLVFLPALLTGPLGKFFIINKRKDLIEAKSQNEAV